MAICPCSFLPRLFLDNLKTSSHLHSSDYRFRYCYTIHGLGSLTCSDPELTSEIKNTLDILVGLPPDMECSYEYIEQAVADSRKGVVLQPAG
jgi:hypothetical protein